MRGRNYTDELSEDTIATALSYIAADLDRSEWAQVGMAIKSELGDAGFPLFDNWSQTGRSYNARDCRDTWKSIAAGGGVTIATLIHMAKQGGFRMEGKPNTITPEESRARRERRERQEQADRERREKQAAQARVTAQAIWDAAHEDFQSHPYLDKKGITQPGKVRVGTYRRWHEDGEIEIPGALLIPIRRPDRTLASLQAIFPDADNPLGRDRDYLPGGDKQGCYFNLGMPGDGQSVVICEGYATACSIHEATGGMVVVAFDAGNLVGVAQAVRAKLPAAQIIIAADDDRFGKRNTGILKANEAALAAGGLIAAPQFDSDDGQPTDFNDLHARQGLGAVLDQVGTWRHPEPPAADNDNDPEAFGKPVDVFGITPPPPLPLNVLPRALVPYCRDQADLTGCDPAIIGLTALVAAAACITDGIRLQPKRHDPTWTESARLWVAVVGDPSTKKSPAISKAVRAVKRIDHRLAEDNAAAYAEWKVQHDGWKDAKKADKNNPPPEPQQPGTQRLVVEDITVEALTEVLKDNPRGVLTIKDELTGWFASMDAYKGAAKGASMDRAHWLEAYNGGRRVIDRITRGNVIVPNWSTCIIGGVQQDMIRRVASTMGNDGLLQRFMVIVARPAIMDADRTPDMLAMKEFNELFDHLAALQPSADVVTLSEEAHECRERVAKYAKRMIDAIDHPHIQAWLGKWDGLYARLLLTYHCIECAGRKVYPTEVKVSGETAARVERLILGTLLHHAIHFYSEVLDAHERQEHMRQLAKLILAKRFDRITKRDIMTLWKAGRKFDWWEIRGLVDTLATMDWLIPDQDAIDTDGRPRAWYVNPQVHIVFETHAKRETQRRREAADALREMREAAAGK